MEKAGYLYCVWNEMYNQIGPNVVKLGETKNLKKRLEGYRTQYVKPSEYLCISHRKFKNSKKAEHILFYILNRYRIRKQREFFDAPPKLIRDCITEISNCSDDIISQVYEKICKSICCVSPEECLEYIENPSTSWFCNKLDLKDKSIDAYFEQFRFKPKHPEHYPNIITKELFTLDSLIQSCTFEISHLSLSEM